MSNEPVIESAPKKSQRGKGYIPNTPAQRAGIKTSKHLLGAPARLPSSIDYSDLILIEDQADSSACVGEANAQACRARLLKMTGYSAGDFTHVPKYSVLGIYGGARTLGRGDKKIPLTDDGCQPIDAVTFMQEYGVPHDATWPFDLSKVNAELPLDVLEDASGFEVTGHYAVDTIPEQRAQEIMHALSEGYFPVFGTAADMAFEEVSNGNIIDRAKGNILGGHMMMFCGYDTSYAGSVAFRIVNSWGTSWGDHGFGNVSTDFITDPRLGDIEVITLGPVNPSLDTNGDPIKRSLKRLQAQKAA
jgi:hypothetical protein